MHVAFQLFRATGTFPEIPALKSKNPYVHIGMILLLEEVPSHFYIVLQSHILLFHDMQVCVDDCFQNALFIYLTLCVCVCVCVRARARARACVYTV